MIWAGSFLFSFDFCLISFGYWSIDHFLPFILDKFGAWNLGMKIAPNQSHTKRDTVQRKF